MSVLCPAYVPTGISDSERNRPAGLANANPQKSEAQRAAEAMMKKAVASGKVSAEQVAGMVLEAVNRGRFWILTHPRIKPAVKARVDDLLEDRAPRNPLAL